MAETVALAVVMAPVAEPQEVTALPVEALVEALVEVLVEVLVVAERAAPAAPAAV